MRQRRSRHDTIDEAEEQHNRVRLVLAVIYAPQSTLHLPLSSFYCIAQLVRVSLEAKGGEVVALVADQRREHAGNLEDSIT